MCRTLQLLWQSSPERGATPSECVCSLLSVLRRWHGNDTVFICKVLTVNSSCPQEDLHRDCVGAYKKHMDQHKRTKPILENYLLIVSTESARMNPTKFVSSNGKEVIISRGHVAFWSGEYLLAG